MTGEDVQLAVDSSYTAQKNWARYTAKVVY